MGEKRQEPFYKRPFFIDLVRTAVTLAIALAAALLLARREAAVTLFVPDPTIQYSVENFRYDCESKTINYDVYGRVIKRTVFTENQLLIFDLTNDTNAIVYPLPPANVDRGVGEDLVAEGVVLPADLPNGGYELKYSVDPYGAAGLAGFVEPFTIDCIGG